MSSVRFEGRVFPTGIYLTIRKHPPIKVRDQGADYDMLFNISVENGLVLIDCDVDEYSREKHHGALLVRAFDIANASVNLAAFGMGLGAKVILETFTEDDGHQYALALRDRPLAALCTAFSPDNEDFDQILELVFSDLRISRAIKDLIESISEPHLIPVLCARSMETLRVIILPSELDRKMAWPMMREHLRISAEYLKSITDHGVGPRHGDHQYVPVEAVRYIADRSWTVMNRFLEYKKRGSYPLPIGEFPELTI